jgi:hypothetical protein
MKKRLLYSILVFGVLFVSACGSDEGVDGEDDDDNRPNNASVEVSGAVDGEFSGTATFATVLGVSHSLTIVLDEDEGTVTMTTFGLSDEGSNPIGDGENPQTWAVVVTLSDLEASGFTSVALTEGSVTITQLDDNRIEGRFNGSGQTSQDETLNIEGDFEATCIDITGITC